jgi:hypothetical protein
MPTTDFGRVYSKYAGAIAYVEVITPEGEVRVGSAFHVGSGQFVTARHVVENNTVTKVATTVGSSGDGVSVWHKPGAGRLLESPRFHLDPTADIALLHVEGINAPTIPIALFDPLGPPILEHVLILGYPPIPLSIEPTLFAATAEINAIAYSYHGSPDHGAVILSTMARGGMSGGVALIDSGRDGVGALGVVTHARVGDHKPTELGYLAVLPLAQIYDGNANAFSRLDVFRQAPEPGKGAGVASIINFDRQWIPVIAAHRLVIADADVLTFICPFCGVQHSYSVEGNFGAADGPRAGQCVRSYGRSGRSSYVLREVHEWWLAGNVLTGQRGTDGERFPRPSHE